MADQSELFNNFGDSFLNKLDPWRRNPSEIIKCRRVLTASFHTGVVVVTCSDRGIERVCKNWIVFILSLTGPFDLQVF